jgi:hypothetical protein
LRKKPDTLNSALMKGPQSPWLFKSLKVVSASSGGLILGAAGVGNAIGAVGGGGFNSAAGASSTSQRTLTVIIKFDGNHKVRDYAYHSSSF